VTFSHDSDRDGGIDMRVCELLTAHCIHQKVLESEYWCGIHVDLSQSEKHEMLMNNIFFRVMVKHYSVRVTSLL
jgi:hypothetical protein